MAHAIKHEITVNIEQDPKFYEALRERLERIINDRKSNRIESSKLLEQLKSLQSDLRSRKEQARSHGLSEQEFAFYGVLKGNRRKLRLSRQIET